MMGVLYFVVQKIVYTLIYNKLRGSDNKQYNYYPRGRVEIRNGKAVIYANGNIADEKLLKWAINEFNLIKENGIEKVEIKADMSNHYLCYLDRER